MDKPPQVPESLPPPPEKRRWLTIRWVGTPAWKPVVTAVRGWWPFWRECLRWSAFRTERTEASVTIGAALLPWVKALYASGSFFAAVFVNNPWLRWLPLVGFGVMLFLVAPYRVHRRATAPLLDELDELRPRAVRQSAVDALSALRTTGIVDLLNQQVGGDEDWFIWDRHHSQWAEHVKDVLRLEFSRPVYDRFSLLGVLGPSTRFPHAYDHRHQHGLRILAEQLARLDEIIKDHDGSPIPALKQSSTPM